MQTVKTFIYGKDRLTPSYNTEPLDDQINAYLKEHPDQKIASISTIIGSGFHEAFVVFDIRDDRGEKDSHRLNKQDYKNHDKGKT